MTKPIDILELQVAMFQYLVVTYNLEFVYKYCFKTEVKFALHNRHDKEYELLNCYSPYVICCMIIVL